MRGVARIVEIVEEARKELSKAEPDLEKVGELMNENQHYLAKCLKVSGDCPISPSKLGDLIEAALNEGALGAKVSGSGGGGCMVALCEKDSWKKVMNSINRVEGHAITTRIPKKGLEVEMIKDTLRIC